MGLLSLVNNGSQGVEYGSDGDWWRSAYTPWPGIINDSIPMPYVTREVAQGLPGIGRGAELIAGVMAQIAPVLREREPRPEDISKTYDTPPLLWDPTPLWHGRPAWMGAVTEDLFYEGDAFGYRGPEVSDYRGYPTSLPLLQPERMAWREGNYIYTTDSGEETISPGDLVHFVVGARSGHRFGIGILERYQTELQIMVATEGSQYVIMKDGKPMGILSLGIDVNEEQAKQYKDGFLAAVRQSGIAAIGNADFKPVQWNSSELSMVPTREFNLRLASNISGVPPYLLGVPSESRVYANMETEWATFIKVTLGRYIQAIENGLSRCFPRGSVVAMNTDALLRSDTKTRFEIYSIAISSGVMEINEARASENLPPIKEPEPVIPEVPPPADENEEDQGDE